ncbi:hypothetical protein QBZ16_000937 [Prototheca wickerhamii]|uniref:RecQ-mediated genome instability protein 1 C-terminal OB-fold domain-containing protein n=1 Tax=Prototheca wickerhamii TaxID=3111 RepID=A0AAD9MH78_PROWI|nr:hypothetical protein QBZ16_000937 [Prototheca wickerhamii]
MPPTLEALEEGLLDAATPTLSQVLRRPKAEDCKAASPGSEAFPEDLAAAFQWTEAVEADPAGRPAFDILGLDEEEADGPAAEDSKAPAGVLGRPFEYLADLAEQLSRGERSFPVKGRIWGVIQRTVGRLQFQDASTKEERYGMDIVIEDGTAAVQARLGHQFLLDFFDMPPLEYRRRLASPEGRAAATGLAQGLTALLAQYCGLIQGE